MKQFDVIALGELVIDFTENAVSAQGNPLFEANPGGAPCNVLSMLKNLGRETAFIGKVGNDMFGEMLIRTVKEQGINTDYLTKCDEAPTTLAFVHTGADGDRSFSFYRNPGADMMLRESDFDARIFENTRIFHFGTLSMTDREVANATTKAVTLAKKAGATISFDPNYRPLLWKDKASAESAMWYGVSNCDILKIADDEIEFLTGTSDIDRGVEIIAKNSSAKIIFATLGSAGSKAYYNGKLIFCPPFLSEKTIETTGAGDTFMGCVLSFIIENGLDNLSDKSIVEMLRFANAAASLVTMKKGALRVMPSVSEVEDLLSGKCL